MLQECGTEVMLYILIIKMWGCVLGFLEVLLKMCLGCIFKINK